MAIKGLSRRTFLKLIGAGFLTLSFTKSSFGKDTTSQNFFETKIGRQRLALIKARQAGMYRDDKIIREKFKLAASHENLMIKRFYSEFAHHPLSKVAYDLLHFKLKPRV